MNSFTLSLFQLLTLVSHSLSSRGLKPPASTPPNSIMECLFFKSSFSNCICIKFKKSHALASISQRPKIMISVHILTSVHSQTLCQQDSILCPIHLPSLQLLLKSPMTSYEQSSSHSSLCLDFSINTRAREQFLIFFSYLFLHPNNPVD